jgi:hypothetical protein
MEATNTSIRYTVNSTNGKTRNEPVSAFECVEIGPPQRRAGGGAFFAGNGTLRSFFEWNATG